ncbi:hypothetical protein ACWD7M_32060 [Streptomyces griseus]
MAPITRIDVYTKTSDVIAADTRSAVYLGIAGREFRLSTGNETDFGKNTETTFVLGTGSNVSDSQYVDPRYPQLDTDDLDRYPTYIRLQPEGSAPAWCVERVQVTVNPEGKVKHLVDNPRLVDEGEGKRILLDASYGTTLHLKRFDG